jgi:hypothetical protein
MNFAYKLSCNAGLGCNTQQCHQVNNDFLLSGHSCCTAAAAAAAAVCLVMMMEDDIDNNNNEAHTYLFEGFLSTNRVPHQFQL